MSDPPPPPPNRGVMRPFVEVGCDIPLLGPMTGRSRPHLSLREGLEQTPFPLALHRVGSVLAVKGSLRRFAPWTAPGRSERRAAYEGKGGGSGRGARPCSRIRMGAHFSFNLFAAAVSSS